MLDSPVTAVRGIGPAKAVVLKDEAGIETVEDLLYYIPRRYLDRSKFKQIADCLAEEEVTVAGEIISVKVIRAKKTLLQIVVTDRTDSIAVIFFGAVNYLHKLFSEGDTVLLSGKISFNRTKQMIHPDFDFIDGENEFQPVNTGRIVPLYRSGNALKKGGFDSRGFRRILKSALDQFGSHIEETLPTATLEKYSLIQLNNAIYSIHFPDSIAHASDARRRLAFNEIFFFQYYLLLLKKIHRRRTERTRSIDAESIHSFIEHSGYRLTRGQDTSLEDIISDMSGAYPMNRLLQGDVGSGKTLIALASAVIAIKRGEQCALMSPTEILAQQHFTTASKLLPENINTCLITGNMPQKEKIKLNEDIASGKIDLIIGTHTLIQSGISFKNLGYVIIDEQHRFGVEQRSRLRSKGEAPDLLVMTATPIPRSLSMTLYGDLDVSYIKDKPENRLPVKTLSFPESRLKGVYNSMRNYIEEGRQIFYVLPVIEESEKIDLKSASETCKHLKDDIFTDFNVELIHGKLAQKDKEIIMDLFRDGKIDILVSTTVIEVGIDIPNANVIIIEHAERFGLAQLHQLRGRVGRGNHQSFCILIHPENISDEARERIKIMTESDDGFTISEKDLELRGSGQLVGTRQHGFTDFEFIDLATDLEIIVNARKEAEVLLSAISDFEAEIKNIRDGRFSRLIKGMRHKRILSLLS